MARLITGIDLGSERFLRSLDRIKDPQMRREIVEALRSLLLLDRDAVQMHAAILGGGVGTVRTAMLE